MGWYGIFMGFPKYPIPLPNADQEEEEVSSLILEDIVHDLSGDNIDDNEDSDYQVLNINSRKALSTLRARVSKCHTKYISSSKSLVFDLFWTSACSSEENSSADEELIESTINDKSDNAISEDVVSVEIQGDWQEITASDILAETDLERTRDILNSSARTEDIIENPLLESVFKDKTSLNTQLEVVESSGSSDELEADTPQVLSDINKQLENDSKNSKEEYNSFGPATEDALITAVNEQLELETENQKKYLCEKKQDGEKEEGKVDDLIDNQFEKTDDEIKNELEPKIISSRVDPDRNRSVVVCTTPEVLRRDLKIHSMLKRKSYRIYVIRAKLVQIVIIGLSMIF